ncbi:MAG TPA: methyltransferase [Candidatus Angelobacter sp.]|nr:methyltransferase [Candidatus Angelobacter sp.]
MKNTVTPERIMQFAWGYAPTLIIEAAVQHRVFDLLDESPKTIKELAMKSGASERGLTAIANALVGFNFLSRKGQRYHLTPESAAFLVSTKPAFLGAIYKHMSKQILPKWLELDRVVRTGKPAMLVNEQKPGSEFFVQFVEALFPMGYHAAKALGEHLKISKTKKPISVLDIAAGSGVWGIALAQQSPLVRISAVDWPKVLNVTKKVAKRHGVGNRLTGIPGDILKADFGSGHNIATLGHILHSEGRERSRRLLKKVFKALASGGTIMVAEFIPNDERTGPPSPLVFAVNMLVSTTTGDTYTFPEMSRWLREAGFKNPRKLDAGGISPLILATKP